MLNDTINIIGHKSPDLDSVAAAVAYAYLKNQSHPENHYIANSADEANAETKYAFEAFGVELPEILTDAGGKKIILVDHNEKEQIVNKIEKAKLVEIIDHHKMKFEYNNPIFIHVEPIGSTCTIIAKMFRHYDIEIPKNLAGIMLSAILIDTVITKSPTCTEQDIVIIKELSKIANVDYQEFGMELFKVKSSVSKMSPEEILTNDYKDFAMNTKKIGVGQIETVDLSEFDNLKEGLFTAMKNKKEQEGYHTIILFITDILKEGSQFLVVSSEPKKFEQAFNTKLKNNECYIEGIMSRKKQVAPPLMKYF
jgi:manganese-dependent inorganic pyrophosphatase